MFEDHFRSKKRSEQSLRFFAWVCRRETGEETTQECDTSHFNVSFSGWVKGAELFQQKSPPTLDIRMLNLGGGLIKCGLKVIITVCSSMVTSLVTWRLSAVLVRLRGFALAWDHPATETSLKLTPSPAVTRILFPMTTPGTCRASCPVRSRTLPLSWGRHGAPVSASGTIRLIPLPDCMNSGVWVAFYAPVGPCRAGSSEGQVGLTAATGFSPRR